MWVILLFILKNSTIIFVSKLPADHYKSWSNCWRQDPPNPWRFQITTPSAKFADINLNSFHCSIEDNCLWHTCLQRVSEVFYRGYVPDSYQHFEHEAHVQVPLVWSFLLLATDSFIIFICAGGTYKSGHVHFTFPCLHWSYFIWSRVGEVFFCDSFNLILFPILNYFCSCLPVTHTSGAWNTFFTSSFVLTSEARTFFTFTPTLRQLVSLKYAIWLITFMWNKFSVGHERCLLKFNPFQISCFAALCLFFSITRPIF